MEVLGGLRAQSAGKLRFFSPAVPYSCHIRGKTLAIFLRIANIVLVEKAIVPGSMLVFF